jgi:aspartyl-tRNA(Asn)/glutamyl-tRNA(Gln) amidotransferase subunit B
MQEGSFRADINLSLKPKGSTTLGTRAELKNLNSFRFIEKAIMHEQARQQDLLESGQKVLQETRLYNPDTNTTAAMRGKESENDYRYFPDPDLLPVDVTRYQIAEVKSKMPALPWQIAEELAKIAELNKEDIHFILAAPDAYAYYKEVKTLSKASDKTIINWLKGQYAAALNEVNLDFSSAPISAPYLAKLLDKVQDKQLSANNARKVFLALWSKEEDIDAIIAREGLQNMQDSSALEEMIKQIINQHPQQAAEFKAGKDKLLGFFVGLIMKQTKGQADPEMVNALLKKLLV